MAAGFGNSLPMVFAGFFSGTVAETFSRKYIVVASIIGQALCTVVIGFSTAFYQVLLARLLLGVTSGFYVPAMLGLVVDYFPEKRRTTAIALTSVGVLIGVAINQLTSVFITMMGWRLYFKLCGALWIVIGALAFIVVKEPERGRLTYITAETS